MTFADAATHDLIGEPVNFDPAVGDATVTVPDVEPGHWAVAAACVGPSTDPAVLEDVVRANASLVQFATSEAFEEAAGYPFPDFPITGPGRVFAAAEVIASEIGETLVPAEMVEPDALGTQSFCVLDVDGGCPPGLDEPGPPPDDQQRDGDGDSATDGGHGDGESLRTTPPATPVAGEPSFTG